MNRQVRWSEVAAHLANQPAGSVLRLPRARVDHPRDGGLSLALAARWGQRADYRRDLGDGRDLVVAELAEHYEASLALRPQFADFERVLAETPGSAVAGLVAAGALLGLALGRSNESAVVGALIGGAAALAGVGIANSDKPELAEAAARILASIRPVVR